MKDADETIALETEVAASAATAPPPRNLFRSQKFKARYYRNFSLLCGGMLLSNNGTPMQIIAQSLLVLQLTQNSGVALGKGVFSFFNAFKKRNSLLIFLSAAVGTPYKYRPTKVTPSVN